MVTITIAKHHKELHFKNRHSVLTQSVHMEQFISLIVILILLGFGHPRVMWDEIEVRCLSIALWLHYRLRYSEGSSPTKSQPKLSKASAGSCCCH